MQTDHATAQCDYCCRTISEDNATTDAAGLTACYPRCNRTPEPDPEEAEQQGQEQELAILSSEARGNGVPCTPVKLLCGQYMPSCVYEYVNAEMLDWTPPTEARDWSRWSY